MDRLQEDGSVGGPIVSSSRQKSLRHYVQRCQLEAGDLILFAVGGRLETDGFLAVCACIWQGLDVPREGHDFLWVVSFHCSTG